MQNYIPLILTVIVTISIIIYTFYSIQLWRTTRAAAEISRQAAFGNLWAELNRYLEILRQQGAPRNGLFAEAVRPAFGIHDRQPDQVRFTNRPRL